MSDGEIRVKVEGLTYRAVGQFDRPGDLETEKCVSVVAAAGGVEDYSPSD